jgi:tetraacyldisaccharide 4'-kinase
MFEHLWKATMRRSRFSLLNVLAFVLWLASFIYRFGAWVKFRFMGSPTKVGIPVISIGNVTMGGTGKTPIVGLLASELLKRGLRVGIVSSGYGRTLHKPIVASGSELQQRRAIETGDEMLLLAFSVPDAVFSIDRTKATAAKRLAESGLVDLIIVDDGFQHRKLHRDLDIVTFDASVDPRMLRPFPYGMLREPLTSLSRARMLILTRAESGDQLAAARAQIGIAAPDVTIYEAEFEITELVAAGGRFPIKLLSVRSAFLFAGIASFDALVKQVKPLVRQLDFAVELADHQRYDRALLKRIQGMADRFDSECILTTGKDWVKAGHFDFGRESYYLDLHVRLNPPVEQMITDLTHILGLKQQDT